MAKVQAKIVAIELRKAGHSYNYIAPKIGVSKGTLCVWLADVPYSPNAETIQRIGKARAASGEAKSRLKRESFLHARSEAIADMGDTSKRDLFMLGLGLYLGEGTKSGAEIRFVNSNPVIMKFIIRWFVEALEVKKENIRVRLHIYPDCNEKTCVRSWSEKLNLPSAQFMRSMIDWRKDKKLSNSGKLPYGTAHLKVLSLGEKRFGVFLARKILAWSDIALEVKKAGLV